MSKTQKTVMMLVDKTIRGRDFKRGDKITLSILKADGLIARKFATSKLGKKRASPPPIPARALTLADVSDVDLFAELAKRGGGSSSLVGASIDELQDELAKRGDGVDPARDFPSVEDLRSGEADWEASRNALRALGITARGRDELADEWAAWLELRVAQFSEPEETDETETSED